MSGVIGFSDENYLYGNGNIVENPCH